MKKKLTSNEHQDVLLHRGYGLTRRRAIGDGQCLYRAVASQMERPVLWTQHIKLKEATERYIKLHETKMLADYILEDVNELQDLINNKRLPGVASIVAMTNILNCHIAIFLGGERAGQAMATQIYQAPALHHINDPMQAGIKLIFNNACSHYDSAI